MTRKLLPFLCALLPLHAAAQTIAPDPLAGFGWFAELAGSCWTGDIPANKTRDTQCYAVEYGRFINGTISMVNPNVDPKRPVYDGKVLFAWDSNRGRIILWYWSNVGAFGVGEGWFEGKEMIWIDAPKGDGSPVNVRSRWARTGADGYRVVREQREGEGWKQLFTVDYLRVKK